MWGFCTPKHSCWGAQASKLVVQVHLMMKKYFVRTLILLACWSPNLVILGFRYNKNLHIILWNPSKFFRHSDSKWETWAMLLNCLGFKEGKRNISTSLRNFHWSLGQTYRKTVLFTSNTKVENKFPKGQSMWHEINNGVYVAD